MPQVQYEGEIHNFPDDFTDADISAALMQTEGSSTSSGNESNDVASESGSFNLSGLTDVAKGFAKSAGRTVQMIPGVARGTDALFGLPPGSSAQSMEATNPAQKLGGYAESVVEMLPAGGAAKAAPGVLAKVAGVSKVRAVANLDAAANAAKAVAIDVNKPGAAAFRIMELRDTGAKGVPMAVNKFIQRITDPMKGALDFEEARKFYSNLTRLSVNERSAMNGTVKFEVGGLVRALNESLTEAARSVGKADEYVAGMKEYARHMTMVKKVPKVAKIATGAAAGAMGAGAGYGLVQRLLGK